MRINLWMIANMLRDENCVIEIDQKVRDDLYGVSLHEVPGKVYIYESGNDTVCYSEENRIILKGFSLMEAFDRLSDIFDFFNEWDNRTSQYCREGNWQPVIDDLEAMLPHPIVIYDTNMRVLAMSSRFGKDDVDAEWDYLLSHGVSSDATIQGMGAYPVFSQGVKERSSSHYLIPASGESPAFFTMSLLHNGDTYAYLCAVGTAGPFYKGQIDSLVKLASVLDNSLPVSESETGSKVLKDFYKELMTVRNVGDFEGIQRTLFARGWKATDHYMVACAYFRPSAANDIHELFRSASSELNIPIVVLAEKILFVLNADDPQYSDTVSKIHSLSRRYSAVLIRSNVVHRIQNIYFCYDQISYVAAKTEKDSNNEYDFHDFAISYIILHSDRESLMYACNPCVYELFFAEDRNMDILYSLEVYLKCDCSLQESASVLYVHKNTISYRVKKGLMQTKLDITSMYDRSYTILSFDVMHALGY